MSKDRNYRLKSPLILLFSACIVFQSARETFAESKNKEDLSGQAQNSEKNTEKKPERRGSAELIYEQSRAVKSQLRPFFSGIEEIFENPALSAGIQSGAGAINRSIDAVMESIFYGLLDNEVKIPLTEYLGFKASFGRNVYSLEDHDYVVADRFQIGVEYNRTIGKLLKWTTLLGIDNSLDLLEIYPRSDALRIHERDTLPPYRSLVNNWFGLLPLLTNLLPPSFNPNEMYDPVRQLSVPDKFPLTRKEFLEMPLHSIRSYVLSGAVRVPVILEDIRSSILGKALDTSDSTIGLIPYTVFSGASYRINVLKKSENLAWVGLTQKKELGHGISTAIGNTLYMLGGVIPQFPMKGVRVPLFLLDGEAVQKLIDQYDHLYAFDLSKPAGLKAYKKAVKGDFEPAISILATKGTESGIEYHFTRNSKGRDWDENSQNELYFYSRSLKFQIEKALVALQDPLGKQYILEGSSKNTNTSWNLLVGEETKKQGSQIEMLVKKDSKGHLKLKDQKDSISVTLDLSIKDLYTTVSEYTEYVKILAEFSGLDLTQLPDFKVDAHDTQQKWLHQYGNLAPDQRHRAPHAPEISLGKFSAFGTLHLNHTALKAFKNQSPAEWQQTLAAAFFEPQDMQEFLRTRPLENRSKFRILSLWNSILKFFSIHRDSLNSLLSVYQSSYALEDWKQASKLDSQRDILLQVFDVGSIQLFSKAVRSFFKEEVLPISIGIHTKPLAWIAPELKSRFGSLNGKKFASKAVFPEPARYRLAKTKLQAFTPGNLRLSKSKLWVKRVTLTNPQQTSEKRQLVLEASLAGKTKTPIKLDAFVRIEQAGVVQFGKLVVAERVFPVTVKNPTLDPIVSIPLRGNNSPINSFLLQQALEFGGEFKVILGFSERGSNAWSEETTIEFRFENGNVSKE